MRRLWVAVLLAWAALSAACGAPGVSSDAGADAATPDDAGGPPTSAVCPADGGLLVLEAGDSVLTGTCAVSGIHLSGTALLTADSAMLTVKGDVLLEGDAGLTLAGGTFTLANQLVNQYGITARDHAVLDFEGTTVSTNGGGSGNLSCNYDGSGESSLVVRGVEFDFTKSWLLATLTEDAGVGVFDTGHFPSEIYPSDQANVRIEGPSSGPGIWLWFPPFSAGALDGIPGQGPYSYSFGRDTPGTVGIGYQVDVVDAGAGLGIYSLPYSNVTLSGNGMPVGIDYLFVDVSTPQSLSGLDGGLQTGLYQNEGRTLELEDATLPFLGWQVYVLNPDLTAATAVPVSIDHSLLNEIGAFERGAFEVADSTFAFAVIDAAGPGSSIHIERSTISSQTIAASFDGGVEIDDSQINGSLVLATGASRIRLLSDTLGTNTCSASCLPRCVSLTDAPPTLCNPFNPDVDVQLIATEEAEIVVAGIDPEPAPIAAGSMHTFDGDALVQTAAGTSFTYDVAYGPAGGAASPLCTGLSGPVRAGALCVWDTTGVDAGSYQVTLRIDLRGESPVTVQRPFTVGP